MDLNGLCNARKVWVSNLGVLLKNRTLWRVWATVFGVVTLSLLLISDVAEVARRGVLNGGILATLHRDKALYSE